MKIKTVSSPSVRKSSIIDALPIMPALNSDSEEEMLPTITEADSESLDSSKNYAELKSSSQTDDGNVSSHVIEKKKKKKKHKHQQLEDQSHILETSQQILIDLCREMKSLQSSVLTSTSEATSAMKDNVVSNENLLHNIQEEITVLRNNLKQLDVAIETKATPEQITEMGRIRSIQILLAEAQQDKDKTVSLYESHARRGYEEIERLRTDLERERGENERLRSELAQRLGNAGDGIGPMSPLKLGYNGPAMYVSGAPQNENALKSPDEEKTIGTFDDMTLDTKQTAENTVLYETKSLKKRIIHMKKKLQVAQLEAKEAGTLRSELEGMRLKMEGLRRECAEKDGLIQRLREDIDALKGGGGAFGMSGATTSSGARSRSVTVTTTTKKKSGPRWWNGM